MVMSFSITGFGPPGTIRMRPQNDGAAAESAADNAGRTLAVDGAPVATAPTSPNPLSDIIDPS
jgi:hypothetical protein